MHHVLTDRYRIGPVALRGRLAMPRRPQTPQARAVAELSATWYRPGGDHAAGARQRDDVAQRHPELARAIERATLANPETSSRYICPECGRPFHPESRVPLDTSGRVLPCRDCRTGQAP